MTTLFRSLVFAASAAVLSSFSAPATAEPVTRDAHCYFFRDEALEIAETCQLYTYGLWEGPITHSLAWPDGVVTEMEESADCGGGGWMIDGRCGTAAYRSYGTFDRLSIAERDRHIQMGAPYLNCVDVGDNSVCLNPLQDI